jgi:hypothetical protein
LERSWPNEYARTERIEQIGEKADEQKPLVIYYNNRNQPLAELLNFPIHSSMFDSPKVAREKRRRLTGESDATAKAPAPETISDAPEETIPDAPPPKVVVNPALTGRIRPEWKGNGK